MPSIIGSTIVNITLECRLVAKTVTVGSRAGDEQDIRCMLMRGGTSKGAYFLHEDLPADISARNDLLLRIMGSPDPRQIDGLGGAHPLTSKVAVISPSEDPEIDVEYLFLQVGVGVAAVSDDQNCGNLLAGVGPFAIERGLVAPMGPTTEVRILMVNTDSRACAVVETPGGAVCYSGDTQISGVPGSAAPVRLFFEGLEGANCGALLPTGHVVDEIDGVRVTCIDNGMPVVVVRAEDIGVSGHESCADLERNDQLRAQVERIRIEAGPLMRLGNVADLTVPKVTLVGSPQAGGAIATRSFIPHRCHDAIGVLGAVSVASACAVPGSVVDGMAQIHDPTAPVKLEHPSGSIEVVIEVDLNGDLPAVPKAGVIRTARRIFDGLVSPGPTIDSP